MSGTRIASHAGSWYSDSKDELSRQLSSWLEAVPDSTVPIGTASSQEGPVSIPSKRARAVIAPHAGYAYSGPAAAWAYKSLDWAMAKRVFLLGPSHHHRLDFAQTTGYATYDTPLGGLPIDIEAVRTIVEGWGVTKMTPNVDKDEHSLEMHLPYIFKMLSDHFTPGEFPPLVPIMIGNTSRQTERRLGALLAPYLSDPGNIFIISSDFCHWGPRFAYTHYQPSSGKAINLRSNRDVSERPIHESIAAVDHESMDAVETGSHRQFLEQLEETGNTVCGRHPIGVFMAAVEASEGIDKEKAKFKFVRYERSNLVEDAKDGSVSYASAFAVL